MSMKDSFNFDIFDDGADPFEELNDVNFDFLNRTGLSESNDKATSYIPENTKLSLHWMGTCIGFVTYKKGSWGFVENRSVGFSLSESSIGLEGTRVPFFVDSLMPESWVRPVASESMVEFNPEFADRYLSNVVIRPAGPAGRAEPIIIDELKGSLKDYSNEIHEYTGRIDACFIPSAHEQSCLQLRQNDAFNRYAAMHTDVNAPRMPGVQQKLPAFISSEGLLTSAIDNSFTHIIKYPDSTDTQRLSLGSVEWFCTFLAKKCGLETEEFAVTTMPGFGPVFIAERFDLPQGAHDTDAILAEDFCSALSLKKSEKYSSDLNKVMKRLLQSSTSPREDAINLLKLSAFSWFVENDDLHLKNMMLLKRSEGDFSSLKSVRFSPAYDIMSTGLYAPQPPALEMGDSDHYDFEGFKNLAALADIDEHEIKDILQDLIDGIRTHSVDIALNLPECILSHEESLEHIQSLREKLLSEDSRMEAMERQMRASQRMRPT